MDVVLGIDVGGTYARVMVVNLSGEVLSFERTIGISISKSKEPLQQAILKAVGDAGCELKDAVGFAAGVKHLNKPSDREWAEAFTHVPGLTCQRTLVNDTVVAHAGAFRHHPGITVIGGTGSNLLGVTELGKQIFIQRFRYEIEASAYDLGIDAARRVIAGLAGQDDRELVEQLLVCWNAANIVDLREVFVNSEVQSQTARTLAPYITSAAARGVPLACEVCNRAIDKLVFGVELLGTCFTSDTVSVALVGSVLQSPYMKQSVMLGLNRLKNKDYKIIDPMFSPVAGAVLMAFESIGIMPGEPILRRLSEHPAAK